MGRRQYIWILMGVILVILLPFLVILLTHMGK